MTNVKFPRRRFLQLAAGAAAVPAVPRAAWAQSYPARTVTIIVPVAAGGTNDPAAPIHSQYTSRPARPAVGGRELDRGRLHDRFHACITRKARRLYSFDGSHGHSHFLGRVLPEPCL